MAPRRLVALMVGLLLISSVITALIPADKRDALDTTEPRTGREMAPPRLPHDGKLVKKTIKTANSAKRPVLMARVGDQLELKVTSAEADTVVLEGLGGSSNVDPTTPAMFNVLLLDPGRFKITTLGAQRVVGEIRVAPHGKAPPSSAE